MSASGSDSEPGAPRGPLPPLSVSILGVDPQDELIREVADFVYATISARAHDLGDARIEVEAKVGVVRERASGQRLMLPVTCETVLNPEFRDIRFESNMSAAQHKHFNQMLNELKMKPSPLSPSPIEYVHQHLIDSFHETGGSGGGKVRVQRDERTGRVVECVRKTRLADLNVYCPKRQADFRVSVNIEQPVPQPQGTASYTRKKDRIAYSHEEFTIDLTQVTSTSTHGAPELLHELEVEITRPDYLLATAERRENPAASEDERIAFDELIRALVNNMRIMVRNIPPNDAWR